MSINEIPFPLKKCIIAVASAKGGVGKSTHSFNLGAYYHLRYEANVLILDVEKRPALSEIKYQGQKLEGKRFDIKHYFDSEGLLDDIELFQRRYDIIIIDTAGTDVDINSGLEGEAQEAMNESALVVADFAVVPVKPSVLDARKTMKFAKSLTKWMKARCGGLQALSFLNEAKPQENLTKSVHAQMHGLPIEYRDEMVNYTPYVGEALLHGISLGEHKPNHPVSQQVQKMGDIILAKVQDHVE